MRALTAIFSLHLFTCLRPTNADDGGYFNQFYVCEDSSVLVQDISILCDSPGAYYYGSGKYRNSALCQAGDKAKLLVAFEIGQTLAYDDAYLTIYVQAFGSVPTEYVYSSESFCSVARTSNGADCPSAGTYELTHNFYWGFKDDEYDYTFTPKVIIGVSSKSNSNQFDLGGANTKQCNGGYFSNWTRGVKRSAANTLASFLVTFGILTFSIVAVSCATCFLFRQAKKQQTKIIIVDEEIDEQSHYNIQIDENPGSSV